MLYNKYMGKLIFKSNKFVEAKYRLSLCEQRLILKACASIKEQDTEFKECTINIREFADEFGVVVNHQELERIVDGLHKKVIHIKMRKGAWKKFNLLSCSEYRPETGELLLRFDPAMSDFLLQIKERFTCYNLKYVSAFTKIYSLRLYELCKQYKKMGKRNIKIHDLLEYLDLEMENSYHIYGNLHRHIIMPAIEEINQYTDIKVSFKEIKRCRKVEAIEFVIENNSDRQEDKKPEEIIDDSSFRAESGEIITEEGLIKEILEDISKQEFEEPGKKLKNQPYGMRVNVLKNVIANSGLRCIYEMHNRIWNGNDAPDFINFYSYKIYPLFKKKT